MRVRQQGQQRGGQGFLSIASGVNTVPYLTMQIMLARTGSYSRAYRSSSDEHVQVEGHPSRKTYVVGWVERSRSDIAKPYHVCREQNSERPNDESTQRPASKTVQKHEGRGD